MSLSLIYIYIIINIVIFVVYFRKDMGVFQSPCLFSLVSLVFISPQLLEIQKCHIDPDNYMLISLLIFITCNIFFSLGFTYGWKMTNNSCTKQTFFSNRLWLICIIFSIIGVGATITNRGVYKGGFVSGLYVVVNFFASYLDYLLVLILMAISKKLKIPFYIYLILALVVILQIDKLLISARRGEAIQFILTLGFFYFYMHSSIFYKKFKYIIPGLFFIGVILNTQIRTYRENSYSGKITVMENIKNIDLSKKSKNKLISNLETNNAIIGINYCFNNGIYDYGTYNWNGIIKEFLPKSMFGLETKNNLQFENTNKRIVTKLTKSGSTMTGYFDSFTSFGVFAFIKFLLIGFFMGCLWKRKDTSIVSLILYITSLSAVLHTITHSTNNIITDFVFFVFFVLPFLKFCIKNN